MWKHRRMRLRPLLPGLALTAAVVAASYALHSALPWASPLTLSVLLGLLVANAMRPSVRTEAGTAFAGRRLMRIGVALLGLELSTSAIAALGWQSFVAVAVVVVCTILGVRVLARLMGLSDGLSLLIGVGYGICGASAIAATRSQTDATREEASYAVALVALCGTLSIAVLPLLGAGMGDVAFGRWVGSAVHDVGQVVATASTRGDVALHAAIVVKLARVALLAPVVLLLSLRARRSATTSAGDRPPVLPLFVAAFLALAALHSASVIPDAVAGFGVTTGKACMAFGLAALGLNVRWADLRAVGGRPLMLGLLAWLLVAGVAFASVVVTSA